MKVFEGFYKIVGCEIVGDLEIVHTVGLIRIKAMFSDLLIFSLNKNILEIVLGRVNLIITFMLFFVYSFE